MRWMPITIEEKYARKWIEAKGWKPVKLAPHDFWVDPTRESNHCSLKNAVETQMIRELV